MKLIKNALLTLVFGLFAVILASSQSLDWVRQMSGVSEESGMDMAVDAFGNVYTSGTFFETVDFDPSGAEFNLSSNGLSDIFIIKQNDQGDLLWAKQIGGEAFDHPGTIILDSSGNILLGGSFRGTVDLDPGEGTFEVTEQGSRAFILKLDSNGDFIWAKQWGASLSSAGAYVNDLALDETGNIITCGTFSGTVDFDPGDDTFSVNDLGYGDGFISKLDANGNFIWAAIVNGNSAINSDSISSIDVDVSGNIIASGPFYGDASNFDLLGGGNCYLKLDGNGNTLWSKQTLGNQGVFTNSLEIDELGNAYMVGRFGGVLDFDPGDGVFNLTAQGTYDAFILKLDSSGNFVWAKSVGGIPSQGASGYLDQGNGLALDNAGNLYITGAYAFSGDFDPGPATYTLTTVGYVDMFVLKLDVDGNFIYAETFGTSSQGFPYFVVGNSVITGENDKVYFTGYFSDTTDFDPGPSVVNLVGLGSTDVFILKMNGESVGTGDLVLENLSIFPNPSNGEFTIDLGKVYSEVSVEIANVFGQTIASHYSSFTRIVKTEITNLSGIYLVKIRTSEGNLKTMRIIKN